MPRRTSLDEAKRIEVAEDIDELVSAKREGWRATPAKARRRQRRYKKRLTQELARLSYADSDTDDDV